MPETGFTDVLTVIKYIKCEIQYDITCMLTGKSIAHTNSNLASSASVRKLGLHFTPRSRLMGSKSNGFLFSRPARYLRDKCLQSIRKLNK